MTPTSWQLLATLSLIVTITADTPNFYVNPRDWPAAAAQQRIALVAGSYDHNVDGVALTLNRLVAHLIRRGHEVLVIVAATGRKQQPVLHAAGAPVVRVPSVPLPIWSEYRLTWGLSRSARRQLADFRPTVVHVSIQDAMGHAAQRWALERDIPVVCSHHTRFERYLSYYGLGSFLGLERLYWFGMRRFHAKCATTLPPSHSLATDLASHGIDRLRVWPRGVDRTLFNASARSEAWRAHAVGGDDAAPILLLVARLRWEKGLATFAAVSAALHARGVRHRVAIVGDGPARGGLARQLPHAVFFGTLTGSALAVAYASSDLFLYPSTTEGWGATCLEAQAAGLPVVATTSSGIVEVVEHGVGGLLAPPHNVSALADAVSALVADDDLRQSMGRAAMAHAASFAWERSGDTMLCEYERHSEGVEPPAGGDTDRPARPAPAVQLALARTCPATPAYVV